MTKRLWTSNFARLAQLRAAGLTGISIARFTPRWFGKGPRYLALAPTARMLRGEDDYEEGWEAILARLDPAAVVAELEALAGTDAKGVCLLCWCARDAEFCHRWSAAQWIERWTGLVVPEWDREPRKGGKQ